MWTSKTYLFVCGDKVLFVAQTDAFVILLCFQCGVPKKGHVCPYQPKLKRRPDEPPPQTRSAAVQVEMDEFMTLRRLNIKIQGFPESYATEPYMTAETMVVGESLQHPIAPPMPPEMTSRMHPAELGSSSSSMPIAETTESRSTGVGDGILLEDDMDGAV
jgi:hypothetical protein